MEQNKVLGIKRSKGEYQGTEYDNYNIYYQVPNTTESFGTITSTYKVKKKLVDDLLNKNVMPIDQLVNKTISVDFNRYGQIESISLVK